MKKTKFRFGGRMVDGIRQRGRESWEVVHHRGYTRDPVTGNIKCDKAAVSVKGTYEDARDAQAELRTSIKKGTFTEPSKLTFGEYLQDATDGWLEKAVKATLRPRTHELYAATVKNHIVPALGHIRLQRLTPGDLQRFYAAKAKTVAANSLALFHGLIHSALADAVSEGLVAINPASRVVNKPQRRNDPEDVLKNCWTIEEARQAVSGAKTLGSQMAALIALALDSGLRKGELCGLQWSDLDLDTGRLTVLRQLVSPGPKVTFGPPKSGRSRTVDISAETISLLRDHKRSQAELKMKNRSRYRDLGLVFAREWGQLRNHDDALGLPLRSCNLGQVQFAQVIKAAGIRRITFHGLRHTCATLMFANGEPVHLVQQRLGHANPMMTLSIYAHALPSQQSGAARRLGKLLHG